MIARIVAIERTGAATPDFGDWHAITVRDDTDDSRPLYGGMQVYGIAEDGTRHLVFRYYGDEETYTPADLRAVLLGAEIEDARRVIGILRATRAR